MFFNAGSLLEGGPSLTAVCRMNIEGWIRALKCIISCGNKPGAFGEPVCYGTSLYVGHGRLAKASNTWVCFLQGMRTGDSLPQRRNLLAPLTGNKEGVNASVSSVTSQHYFDSVGRHAIIFNVRRLPKRLSWSLSHVVKNSFCRN